MKIFVVNLMLISHSLALKTSIDKTWLCGVWVMGDELTAPMANYFNFPTVFRTSCPIKKTTRQFARLCQKVGLNWEKNWSPTKAGFRGTEGDKICGLVKKEFNEPDIPSVNFPNGIRLGFFYNFCGEPDWTWTGLSTNANALCCKGGKYLRCDGLVEQSSNVLVIKDILAGGESIISKVNDSLAAPQYFGPERFVLTITSDENVYVNREIELGNVLDEDSESVISEENEDENNESLNYSETEGNDGATTSTNVY